jgi:non-ribosomal peptide synthetase component F
MLTAQADVSIGAQRLCDYMARALTELVQRLERDPDQPLRQLDLLPDAERAQLLDVWSIGADAAAVTMPDAICVHERFENQAARRPDALALVSSGDGRRLTYGALNAQANQLAHHLRTLGVRPDDRVAIIGPRSAEIAVAILAVLKAGGAYVPLDPSYPPERLGQMLDDSQPVVVLHIGSLPRTLAQHLPAGAAVVDMASAAAWQHEPTSDPARRSASRRTTSPTSSIRPDRPAAPRA